MARALHSALAASALSLGLGCGSGEPPPNVERSEQPIFGGTLDTTHAGVAALIRLEPDGQSLGACSSTIIATKGQSGFLLTAAHCAVEVVGDEPTSTPAAPESLFVITGNDWATSPDFYQVLQVDVHAGYDAQVQSPYDIAVVRFAGALPGTPTIPVLAAAEDDIALGSQVTLVGYGVTETNDENSVRYRVGQEVVDLTSQNLLYDQTNGQGMCSGDSGGPALYATPNGERVAGVSSYVAGACEFGVSVRASTYNGFIAGVIAGAPATLGCDECTLAAVAPGNPCEQANLACSDGSPCADFVACAQGCAAEPCVDACRSEIAAGARAYDAVISCLCNDGCATECATNPICDTAPSCGGLTSPIPTCLLCMQQNCCAQSAACAGDPACAACVESSSSTCSSPAFGALQACRATCAGDPCRVTRPAGNGGAGGSAAAGGAGSGASGGTASGGESSGGSQAGTGGTMQAPVYVTSDSGCGCKLTTARPRSDLLGVALAGLCGVLLGRRRRFSFR